MKKMLFLFAAMLTIAAGVQAQNGPRQQMPVEDRVARTIERMTTELSLTEQQAKDMNPVYTSYFTEMDKMRNGGERPTPEARQKLTETRDEKLKKILSEDQMKKLKELEAEMRQRRPGGGR